MNPLLVRRLGWAGFAVYLLAVLDVTLFEYQSLVVMKLFHPELILRGLDEGQALNLVPLVALTAGDLRTSLLNVLLFVPFGLGLPMLTRRRLVGTLALGFALSLSIETLQWLSGRLAGTAFRIADVNDLIFNTLGALMGYGVWAAARKLGKRTKPPA